MAVGQVGEEKKDGRIREAGKWSDQTGDVIGGLQSERQPFSAMDGGNNRGVDGIGEDKTWKKKKGKIYKTDQEEREEEMHVWIVLLQI